MIKQIIRYFGDIYQTRKLKKQQREWQRAIDVPEGTPFCPMLYNSCNRIGHDTNCFVTKSPGCYNFRKYLQDKDPRALVTREYCTKNLEDIVKDAYKYDDKRDKV